jgi:hypothetical protein
MPRIFPPRARSRPYVDWGIVRSSSISPEWQLLGLAQKVKSQTHSEDQRENETVKIIERALPIRRETDAVGGGGKVALGIFMDRAG